MKPVAVSYDDEGNLHLAARVIPQPASVSDLARRFLTTQFPSFQEPELMDKAAWKHMAAEVDKMFEPMVAQVLAATPATVKREELGGAVVYVGEPQAMKHPDWAHLSIHGGSWVFLGGEYVRADAARYAAEFGCTTYSLDYRMPPDHPFPAAVDDAYAAYKEIIKRHDPKKIVVSGGSAGGAIAAGVVLKARDNGLPTPGAVVLLTGSIDLTRSGDSIHANDGLDNVLRPFGKAGALYAGGHDLTDPYLSPLFGDFTKGFPPTMLQTGTRDLLLSDSVRLHRKLLQGGNETELHVWEAMPHGGFGGGISGESSPEDLEIKVQFLTFIEKHLG
jgi:epsilon-lactone hydrolase